MLADYARMFISAVERLQSVRYGLTLAYAKKGSEGLKKELSAQLKIHLKYVSLGCALVELDATKYLADKLLGEMLRNELKQTQFLYVPRELVPYYDNKSLCRDLVAKKFERAVPDIIEAGNCYSLERPTACVFHLMRVIPYGMAVLAKKLKVKYSAPIETLEWGIIIPPIDKAVRELQQQPRSKKRAENQKYYSEIVSHLYFCKDAWRNHVSHGRDSYDMPKAKSVMDHVCLVMSLLADRM